MTESKQNHTDASFWSKKWLVNDIFFHKNDKHQ